MKSQNLRYRSDEIIIPTENGYVRIPSDNLRGWQASKSATIKLKKLLQKANNYTQFGIMISGLILLFVIMGYTVAGTMGIIASIAIGLITLLFSSNFSIKRVLRKRNIWQLNEFSGSHLFEMVQNLVNKTNLKTIPKVFLENTPEINAFTIEDSKDAAIVISRGLVETMNQREVKGVLAHEIAHLKNNDIKLMMFIESIRRVTTSLTTLGYLLLLVNLPLVIMGAAMIPWHVVIALIIVPGFSYLLQLSLSRNREFKADMDAIDIAGSAQGLASALRKIEMQQNYVKNIIKSPFHHVPEILRTHPNIHQRIKRLKSIEY